MKGMGLGEQAQVDIESVIAKAPEAHPVIRGLRGVRKARFALPGRGRSGGGRVVYYVAIAPGVLSMMTAYPKNEQDDLSPMQRKAIRNAIAGIKGIGS